jgi:hypothetical protein
MTKQEFILNQLEFEADPKQLYSIPKSEVITYFQAQIEYELIWDGETWWTEFENSDSILDDCVDLGIHLKGVEGHQNETLKAKAKKVISELNIILEKAINYIKNNIIGECEFYYLSHIVLESEEKSIVSIDVNDYHSIKVIFNKNEPIDHN